MIGSESESVSCSVMSDSLQLHGLYSDRLLCPWDSPGKNTGVGSHSLLQRIFPTQGLNPSFLHCREILSCLSHQKALCGKHEYWSKKASSQMDKEISLWIHRSFSLSLWWSPNPNADILTWKEAWHHHYIISIISISLFHALWRVALWGSGSSVLLKVEYVLKSDGEVISLQLIKINEKKKSDGRQEYKDRLWRLLNILPRRLCINL